MKKVVAILALLCFTALTTLAAAGVHDVGGSDESEFITNSNAVETHNNENKILIWVIVLVFGFFITVGTDEEGGVNKFLTFACIYIAAFFIWWICQISTGQY